MNNNNHIDNLFREKLTNRNIVFDASSWEKAEAILNAKSRKRRGAIIWFAGATLFLLITIGSIFIFNTNQDSKQVLSKTPSSTLLQTQGNQQIKSISQSNESLEIQKTTKNHLLESNEKNNTNTAFVSESKQTTTKQATLVKPNNKHMGSHKQPTAEVALNTNPIFTKPQEKEENINKIPSLGYVYSKLEENSIDNFSCQSKDNTWLDRSSFGLVMGTSVSKPFKNTSGRVNYPVFGMLLGIRYSHRVNDDFSFDANVIYQNRGGLNSSIWSEKDIITKTENKSLHYIDVPLYFNYRYDRHGVLLGYQHSFLVGSIDKINVLEKTNNELVVKKSTTKFQNSEAFSSFDGALVLGYEFVWTDQFNVGIRGNYGLFDVTDNISFDNSIKDRNVQIRLTVDYKFLNY